jgi:hypothetical protein
MRSMVVLLTICGLTLILMGGAVVWFVQGWRIGGLSGPPPIARNMYPIAGAVSPSWSRRLRERFPIGSPERELVRRLQREKFQVDGRNRRAGFGWARYPCVYTLTVIWRADELGRVRAVEGGLLDACTHADRLIPERIPRPLPPPPREPALVPGAQSA